MRTPLGSWIGLWASGWDLMQTGLKLNETMTASQAVIDRRIRAMAEAARDPLNAEYAEFSRMILEKGVAFSLSAKATSRDLQAIQSDVAANNRLLADIASGRRVPTPIDMLAIASRSARILGRTMAVGGHALAPIHRRVVANDKRLKRKR